MNLQMSKDAQNLVKALKGDTKVHRVIGEKFSLKEFLKDPV